MILEKIVLINFRRHKKTTLNFSERLNYIVGGNGQGKTSVLEAIYYLCTTKNFGATDSSALRFNEKEFEITGLFKGSAEDTARVAFIAQDNRKYYSLNGKNISRPSGVIGKFPVVLLSPGDHAITQGAPSERRKFVDSILSQARSAYLPLLQEYNKTLRQRGVLLNRIKEAGGRNAGELIAWNENLIKTGSAIISRRKEFISEFKAQLVESYNKIMNDKEVPGIKYAYLGGYSGTDIERRFGELIKEGTEEEIRRGMNLTGPHRDDFIFEIDGLNLKAYGSQGQHKTFQVALRFAEYFYIKRGSGKAPLFMLDDVFGELDVYRSEKISSCLCEVGQTFITMTDLTNIQNFDKSSSGSIIRLQDGDVIYA